jgi:hypothetical protein
MPLLRPRDERPDFSTKLRCHTVLRCPLNGHQVGACRGLCEPSPEGDGLCGRLAPHALIGRTQAAIAAQQAEQSEDALWVRSVLPVRPPRTLARPGKPHRGF